MELKPLLLHEIESIYRELSTLLAMTNHPLP
jgi:hypothetical protein